MGKRFVVVGGATAVAGLVLGASIVLGPPSEKSKKPTLPGDIDAPNVGTPTDDPDNIRVNIQGFDYTTFEADSDGQLRGMRLRATRTNLKPQGVTELIKPHAEIRLGTQRAITITADKADMEMEDGKPRQGQFSGNVVVTLAQAPEGTELILDPADPAHEQFIQQRIYLDEATDFSIEDDTINTRGPVHVTSPQVDFFGVGLRLAYNTQRERIEQLVINEGRYLIINPEAKAPGFDDKDKDADAKQSEASHKTQQTPLPAQFYAATFQDNVLVRDGVVSQLAGQNLTIDFSLGTEAVKIKPLNPDATGRLPRIIPVGQLAQADADAASLPAIVIPQHNAQRALFNHDPERDIVVTWTGRLSVLPHATRPEPLADEDDALITLTGPNAYAQTIEDGEVERLETNKLQYLLSKEQTTAYTSDDRRLRLLSTAMGGEITGQQLTVRQAQGTATVLGPGELTFTNKDDGKTLHLTWKNRLDLELYTEKNTPPTDATTHADAVFDPEAQTRREPSEASGNTRSQTKILGVKTATFDGVVTARHTDFDLDSDTLTIAFAKPDKDNDVDNSPTTINASGSVAIKARGDADDETFDISAGRLTIDLKLDEDDEPYASVIRAVDDVQVQRPGSMLACNRVSVELIPPSQTKTTPKTKSPTNTTPHADAKRSEASGNPPTKTPSDRFAQVRSVLAVGRVRANLDYDDRRVDLVADQLFADVANDKLTLAADSAKAPAEIIDLTTGRKLTGKLVEMDDQAEVLTITGPGTLATVLADPNEPDAGIEDAFLSIAWTESMSFNNVTGQADFAGDVRSESRRSIDSSEMTCDALAMLFTPDYSHDPNRLIDDEGEDAYERQIRSALATGNVQFIASAWNVDEPGKINNRIRLEGPKLVITNKPVTQVGQKPTETLVVKGKGRMVLEDYRAPDKEDANNKARLTGRGATLFRWDDSMTLDALDNTATLLGSVQMTHIPKDEKGNADAPVQLDCKTLVADMIDTGGLSVWLSDDAPDAQVQTITATDNVRLLQQGTRAMRGDVMTFNAKQNNVVFNAKPDHDVVLEDLTRDTSTRTNKITWDLTTDRIEIDQLRGGVAPLGETNPTPRRRPNPAPRRR